MAERFLYVRTKTREEFEKDTFFQEGYTFWSYQEPNGWYVWDEVSRVHHSTENVELIGSEWDCEADPQP